jgi:hypothetical protein
MQGALPNEAQPGLHSKPMDAAIGRITTAAAMVNNFK